MRITLETLARHMACSSQVTVFEKLFGRGGEVTRAGCERIALDPAFSISSFRWAVRSMFPLAQKTQFHHGYDRLWSRFAHLSSFDQSRESRIAVARLFARLAKDVRRVR